MCFDPGAFVRAGVLPGGPVPWDLQSRWRGQARRLKGEVYALYLACRDPRVPWYAKAFGAAIVAYAFSPIDLIPDFIPILGYLDDLLLLPLAILAVRAMIPDAVMADCRLRAQSAFNQSEPVSRVGAAIVIGLWIMLAGAGVLWAMRALGSAP